MFDLVNEIMNELNKNPYVEDQPVVEGHWNNEVKPQRKRICKNKDEQIKELENRIMENEIFIKRTRHENEAIEHVKYLTLGRLSKDTFDELMDIIESNIEYIDVVMRNQQRLRKELETLRKQSNVI